MFQTKAWSYARLSCTWQIQTSNRDTYAINKKKFISKAASLVALSQAMSTNQQQEDRITARRRLDNDHVEVRISKEMSRLLRHKPPPNAMDAAGWVSLPVLLRHMRNHTSEEQIRRIVATSDKKRFVMDDSVNPPRIRAAQGHSVELTEAILEPVTDPSKIPVAVHVTSVLSWEAIRTSGQLLRMKRTHIHFATEPHHMRRNNWADVYLRLDLKAALQQGLKFFLSSNSVLLCEGPVPVTLVQQVELQDLPPEWNQAQATKA